MTTMQGSAAAVGSYFRSLQDRICDAIEAAEETESGELAAGRFDARVLAGERGGEARPRVLSEGRWVEKAAVNFSYTRGERLPAAATERRPELRGASYEALSISLIVHPRNPYVPTTHANLRFFVAGEPEEPVWWFGGGFDLTPYYGFEEDAVHWHRCAKAACDPFGEDLYPRFKRACDEYFYLPHRGEPRGIGGLFFDDLDDVAGEGFEGCYGLVQSVGNAFLPAYLPIVERRWRTAYGERERAFQLYRRGRYVEFNLVYDRGTRHGLQAGGRTESILASLPPVVAWAYDWHPEPGSAEARLYAEFLRSRDWLA